MTPNKFLLTLFWAFTVALCNAQTHDTTGTDSTKKHISFHSLSLFNHYPGFYPAHIASLKPGFYKPDQDNFRRLFSSTTHVDQTTLRLDYAPFPTPANFSSLSRHDFNYQYDPSNPYGVTNPTEGIIYGSFDYLMWKIFGDN